jgi:hypothetical protein
VVGSLTGVLIVGLDGREVLIAVARWGLVVLSGARAFFVASLGWAPVRAFAVTAGS